MEPVWLLENGDCAPLYAVERFLIPVTDVAWVEMLKTNEEMTASDEQVKAVEDLLVSLQNGDEIEQQSTPAAAPKFLPALQSERARNVRIADNKPKPVATPCITSPTTATQDGK